MAEVTDAAAYGLAALGGSIRALRKRQGLSVDALSQRADVSFGALSQLERGKGNPSFMTLNKLAEALGMPLTQLMHGAHRRDDMVVRAGERQQLPPMGDAGDQPLRELLTPGMHASLQVIRTVLPKNFSNEGKAFRHLGMECIIVETGLLSVTHGDRQVELGPGDAMTYECSTPHWWANAYDGETVVLGAVTPLEV